MITAPAMGCCASSLASKASAGGQLEQPSDVKSSRTTGTLTVLLAGFCACGAPDPDWQVAATIRARAAGSKWGRCFMLGATPAVHYILRLLRLDGRNLDCIPRKMLLPHF